MKLTILTDNGVPLDSVCCGESGACFYLEEEGRRILFDTGFTDVCVRNAGKLGVDLSAVDTVVLSHGHDDHSGGLRYLPRAAQRPRLIAHPYILRPKRGEEGESIGLPVSREWLEARYELCLTAEPAAVTSRLVFLGQIPRKQPFEEEYTIGETLTDEGWQPDRLLDDSALVYCGREGLTVITGCSHSGICNIVSYAREVCGDDRVAGVIGGFHLQEASPRVKRTAEYLKALQPRRMCPCHCTGFAARAAIHRVLPVQEVGAGTVLEIE